MVHTRINERTTNPNPYINFITALPSFRHTRDSVEDPQATELLRALAAQLKPVMKARGFTVNSFEEVCTYWCSPWRLFMTLALVREQQGVFGTELE